MTRTTHLLTHLSNNVTTVSRVDHLSKQRPTPTLVHLHPPFWFSKHFTGISWQRRFSGVDFVGRQSHFPHFLLFIDRSSIQCNAMQRHHQCNSIINAMQCHHQRQRHGGHQLATWTMKYTILKLYFLYDGDECHCRSFTVSIWQHAWS